MLEKIKGAIKNRQSRDTSNIVYKTQWKKQRQKQTKNKNKKTQKTKKMSAKSREFRSLLQEMFDNQTL